MVWVWTSDLGALQAYLGQASLLLEPRRNDATGSPIGGPPLVWDTPQQYQGGWTARQHPGVDHSFATIEPVFSE